MMTFSVWRDSTAYKPPYRSPHTPAGIPIFARLGRGDAMRALTRGAAWREVWGCNVDDTTAERILAGKVPGYTVRAHIDMEEVAP